MTLTVNVLFSHRHEEEEEEEKSVNNTGNNAAIALNIDKK